MKQIALTSFIARKYFLSRKNANFINVLSLVSVLALAVGTGALFVILSVFNGMSELIRGVHHSFDSEILIQHKTEKSFLITEDLIEKIQYTEGVELVSEVIEDEAFVNYKDVQKVVKVKGISSNFSKQNDLIHHMFDTLSGFVKNDLLNIQTDSTSYAIIGVGLQHELGINIHHGYFPIELYYPKRTKKVIKGTPDSFNRINISAGGVFELERQYDENYIIIPLDYAELLFEYSYERTGIEVKSKSNYDVETVISYLSIVLGPEFKVLNSDEQHTALYKAIKVEKLAVFIILSFVLCVAAVNIFLTITMIVISKRKDIAVLKSYGATRKMIRNIFLIEGGLIGLSATVIGLTLGVSICYLQQEYGVVGLNAEATLVHAFPIQMKWLDFFGAGIITLIITVLISIYPANKAGGITTIEEL